MEAPSEPAPLTPPEKEKAVGKAPTSPGTNAGEDAVPAGVGYDAWTEAMAAIDGADIFTQYRDLEPQKDAGEDLDALMAIAYAGDEGAGAGSPQSSRYKELGRWIGRS